MSYSATGFTQPSVNTTLAGLLLHWHALSSAVALVSIYDIWTLSRIYSDALLLNPAKPLTAWHFPFIFFFFPRSIKARSLSWHYGQYRKYILDVPCHHWRCVTFSQGVFTSCGQVLRSVKQFLLWFVKSYSQILIKTMLSVRTHAIQFIIVLLGCLTGAASNNYLHNWLIYQLFLD